MTELLQSHNKTSVDKELLLMVEPKKKKKSLEMESISVKML